MKAVQVVDGRLQMTDWADVDEPQIVEAVQRRAAGSPDRFNFTLERERHGIRRAVQQVPDGFGEDLAGPGRDGPTADFVGELERTNRLLVWLMLAVVGGTRARSYTSWPGGYRSRLKWFPKR